MLEMEHPEICDPVQEEKQFAKRCMTALEALEQQDREKRQEPVTIPMYQRQ